MLWICIFFCFAALGKKKFRFSSDSVSKETKQNISNYKLLLFCKLTEFYSFLGGEDGIRTRDPLIANQVLYQLSYIPGSLF